MGSILRVSPDGSKIRSLRHPSAWSAAAAQARRVSSPESGQGSHAGDAELRKVDGGIDPQAERLEAKRAAEQAKRDNIDTLCESYIERHAKVKKRTWCDDSYNKL